MSNLLNKGNTFYFIASSLVTLTLLTSLVLISVPSSLILALVALSALAIVFLYKIISNNRRMENKFAQKERELRNEITLERKATSRGIEELNSQLYRLMQEKEEWLNEELERAKDQLKRKERVLSFECQELCDEDERLNDNLRGQLLDMQRKLIELQSEGRELFFKSTVREKLLKMILEKKSARIEQLEKKGARIEQLEKQLKEKEEEIKKISKSREILDGKVKELHKEEDALDNELSAQQSKVKEIAKKNKYLSEQLKNLLLPINLKVEKKLLFY